MWHNGIRACQLLLVLCAAAVMLNEKWQRLGGAKEVVAANRYRLPRAYAATRRDQPARIWSPYICSARTHLSRLSDNIGRLQRETDPAGSRHDTLAHHWRDNLLIGNRQQFDIALIQ